MRRQTFSHHGERSLWDRSIINNGDHSTLWSSLWDILPRSFNWLPRHAIGWVVYESIGPLIILDSETGLVRVIVDPYDA